MPARLPDFLGLGTQKGGTTSLHQWLSSHPQIFLPECKEIHYFDLQYKKSEQWYTNHFNKAKSEQICGEITPFYLFHPEAPKRIKNVLPEVKMIVLLRDPVERAISQIAHSIKRDFEHLEPEQALAEEEKRIKSGSTYSLQKHTYASRSRYIEQLDRYEKLFDKRQMLIIKSENMFKNPEEYWYNIQEFLNIEQMNKLETIPRANKGDGIIKNNEVVREKLKKELWETAKTIRERYGFGWEWCK